MGTSYQPSVDTQWDLPSKDMFFWLRRRAWVTFKKEDLEM